MQSGKILFPFPAPKQAAGANSKKSTDKPASNYTPRFGTLKRVEQCDLVAERILSRDIAGAIKCLQERRAKIRALLEDGAEVEPGRFHAFLMISREGTDREYTTLVIR